MKKPITILYEEFKQDLINLVNNSGLPPFVVEPVIKEVYLEVKQSAKQQYEKDIQEYQLLQPKELNN